MSSKDVRPSTGCIQLVCLTAFLTLGGCDSTGNTSRSEELAAVIEVRTYRTVPGGRETIMTAMASRAMPVQVAIGMKMLGPFPSCEDLDTFVWLRAFPDADSRDAMKGAFYGGDLWLNELEAEVMPLIEHYESVLVEDTVGLWQVWPERNC